MGIPGFVRSYTADGAIGANLIVKPGGSDGTMALATGATDALMGVLLELDAADGDRIDIVRDGIADILYGGDIAMGDPLTSDSQGRAIAATLGQNVIGNAEVSGSLGDIGQVMVVPSALAPTVLNATGQTLKGLAVAEFNPTATAGQRTVAKHGLGVFLPDKAIITRDWYEVLATFTSATDSATVALGVDTDSEAGIKAAVAISDGTNPWDAGLHEGIQGGAVANAIKLTAGREICATVAVDALTAGRARVYVEYALSV